MSLCAHRGNIVTETNYRVYVHSPTPLQALPVAPARAVWRLHALLPAHLLLARALACAARCMERVCALAPTTYMCMCARVCVRACAYLRVCAYHGWMCVCQ